jgi:predicted transcriptional regulator
MRGICFSCGSILSVSLHGVYGLVSVRFLELGAVLDPGKTPKIDKCAILNDAIRAVTELRSEAEKLKDSNESLQEKIKELKVCTVPVC